MYLLYIFYYYYVCCCCMATTISPYLYTAEIIASFHVIYVPIFRCFFFHFILLYSSVFAFILMLVQFHFLSPVPIVHYAVHLKKCFFCLFRCTWIWNERTRNKTKWTTFVQKLNNIDINRQKKTRDVKLNGVMDLVPRCELYCWLVFGHWFFFAVNINIVCHIGIKQW